MLLAWDTPQPSPKGNTFMGGLNVCFMDHTILGLSAGKQWGKLHLDANCDVESCSVATALTSLIYKGQT